MPFADELHPVLLVPFRMEWADDFESLANELRRLDLAPHGAIEHIGSTAVPGLVAKDVIDVQIRVPVIARDTLITRLAGAGFRHRPEEWNNVEATRAGPEPKLVFAPAAGARSANLHVRTDGTAGARDALLFRDYLRSDAEARDAWADFKCAIVEAVPQIDIFAYGQIKQPAWTILMLAADAWADAHDWLPEALGAGPERSRRSDA